METMTKKAEDPKKVHGGPMSKLEVLVRGETATLNPSRLNRKLQEHTAERV